MKLSHLFIACVWALALPVAHGEMWPTLEEFASQCVLVVKARQVGMFDEEHPLSFKVLETWKGHFDPHEFVRTTPEGYITAWLGEHGVKVTANQEIIICYSRHNQPEGRLSRHNTAFPIRDGKIVCASTAWTGGSQEMSVEDFKRAIQKAKK